MDKKNVKYFDGLKRKLHTPNFKKQEKTVDESFLLFPGVNSKKKTQVQLKSKIHPTDFSVPLKSENIKQTKHMDVYYGNHYGPGRGFGNMDTNNNIRDGQSTRLSNDQFFKVQESQINNRRDIITKNYQNPNNLILPFPRGGELTRKSTLFEKIEDEECKFEFKY